MCIRDSNATTGYRHRRAIHRLDSLTCGRPPAPSHSAAAPAPPPPSPPRTAGNPPRAPVAIIHHRRCHEPDNHHNPYEEGQTDPLIDDAHRPASGTSFAERGPKASRALECEATNRINFPFPAPGTPRPAPPPPPAPPAARPRPCCGLIDSEKEKKHMGRLRREYPAIGRCCSSSRSGPPPHHFD